MVHVRLGNAAPVAISYDASYDEAGKEDATGFLELIRTHLEETGFPPTRAEIAVHFGFSSPNAAEDHLRALERKGAIEILPGASRGLRILQADGLPPQPVKGL